MGRNQMVQSPPSTPSAEASILPLIMGHMASRVIFVAAQLGVADLLAEGGQSVAALASRTRTHAPSLQPLLRALASLGVLDETDPRRIALTPLAGASRTARP